MNPSKIRETVRRLNNSLGPTLVAALSGARDRTISPRWESKDGPLPDAAAAERLQCAIEVWKLIEASEGPDVARLWFLGANPWVGDESPVTAIREGRFQETATAARALIDDSFSGSGTFCGAAAHIDSMTRSELPAPETSTTRAAKQLISESGLSANQIGRLVGGLGRAIHSWAAGSTPSPRMANRLLALHRLVFCLEADTPEERRALMLDSSRGPSLFLQFQNETPRPQQIQFPVPVMERLGVG